MREEIFANPDGPLGVLPAGRAAASSLPPEYEVVRFERERWLGGHAPTIRVASGPDAGLPLGVVFATPRKLALLAEAQPKTTAGVRCT